MKSASGNFLLTCNDLQKRDVVRRFPPQFLSRRSTDVRSYNVNRRAMHQCLAICCSKCVLMSKLNLFCQNTCQKSRFSATHTPGRCAYHRTYSSRRDESLLYESFGTPFYGTPTTSQRLRNIDLLAILSDFGRSSKTWCHAKIACAVSRPSVDRCSI